MKFVYKLEIEIEEEEAKKLNDDQIDRLLGSFQEEINETIYTFNSDLTTRTKEDLPCDPYKIAITLEEENL